MTLNDSWGFNRGDDAWKNAKTIVDNLATCARGGGNYLLNIGPEPDGSIPPETAFPFWRRSVNGSTPTVRRSTALTVCWAEQTSTRTSRAAATRPTFTSIAGPAIRPQPRRPALLPARSCCGYRRTQSQALSAKLLKTNQKVEFTQDEFTLRLTGLPLNVPDTPATVIEVECNSEPSVDHGSMRSLWPRLKVGIST